VNVSFSGGNTYKTTRNNGELKLNIVSKETSKTFPRIKNNFDVYSSGETPITLSIKRNNKLVLLSNDQGKEFALGELIALDSSCNYDCNLILNPSDKVTFKSELSFFKYWNGIHILSNPPLFIRYHYYTLQIKKQSGEVLTAKWKYGIYKIRNGCNENVWSGDQCTGNFGLVKLKIKN
jgi:hypothetical protein